MMQGELLESWEVIQRARMEHVEYQLLLDSVVTLCDYYMVLHADVGCPMPTTVLANALDALGAAECGTKFSDQALLAIATTIHYHCLELEKCQLALLYGTMAQPN